MAYEDTQSVTLRQQLSSIVGNVPFGILTLSYNFEIAIINAEAVKLLGFPESGPDDLIDVNYARALVNIPELIDNFETLIISRRHRQFDLIGIKTGDFEVNIKCRSMLHGSLIVLEDLAIEKALIHQATHDNLTQLINRQHFEERLEAAICKARDHKLPGAIVFIDLDRFKPINDTAGHAAGDELLVNVSAIMQNRIRDRDTIARIGGNEFAILLEDCPMGAAEQITEKIRHDIDKMDFAYHEKLFHITLSAGIAPIDESCINTSVLINTAETACQYAKNKGRNQVHVINQAQGEFEAHVREVTWLEIIDNALKNDRFILYAQKITSLKTDQSSSYHELLIRLKNEDGTIISPGKFIPAAERFDLMPQIDRWVLQEAFSRIQPGVACSINLSGQTVSDETLAGHIEALQARFGVDARQINFEITETAAIRDLDKTRSFIKHLKASGFQFSLDDFGSGLSSFRYLKDIAVDHLKIDGAFVKEIVSDKISYAMVKSIHDVGHSMGLKTVAEYVENAEILNKLKEIGVDFAQGYHLHKPQPFDEIINATDASPLKVVK